MSTNEPEERGSQQETTMGNVLEDLYYRKRVVNPDNVSVHSAFICLLHLANEKELEFDA